MLDVQMGRARIHQADNAVIDIAGKVGGEVRGTKACAELGGLRNRRQIVRRAHAAPTWPRHEDPGVAIPIRARESPSEYPSRIERIAGDERRDLGALSTYRLETPAMVLAGDLLAVEPAVGERNPAMRTAVAHRENAAVTAPSQNQRNTQQHCR